MNTDQNSPVRATIAKIVIPSFILLLSQAAASSPADDVATKTKASAIKMCKAAYTLWYAANRGQKRTAPGIQNLVIQSCTGRLFIAFLKCNETMFDALDVAKAAGAKEVPATVSAESTRCLEQARERAKKDTELLAEYGSAGQEPRLRQTLKKWQQEGSLKYLIDP